VLACWSTKGGSGTTVVVAALGLIQARRHDGGALLVDLGGDLPAVLGQPEPPGPGLADWLEAGREVPADGLARLEVEVAPGLALVPRGEGPLVAPERAEVLAAVLAGDRRPVVVDCGCAHESAADHDVRAVLAGAGASVLVTRACYLALRRAVAGGPTPAGVVVVAEPGRALSVADVGSVLVAPVLAEVPWDPVVARAVDAGLLASRLPRSLDRALQGLPRGAGQP
jgi:hypothetical protein